MTDHTNGMKREVRQEQLLRRRCREERGNFLGTLLPEQSLKPHVRIDEAHHASRHSIDFACNWSDVYWSR